MGLPTFGGDSLLDRNALSASPAALTGFSVTALADDRAFTIFKPSAATTLDIITDAGIGNTDTVDYFGMIGHDLFTQGANLTFAHSPDNITYTTVFSVTPGDDLVIFRSFATTPARRFFRAQITGASAAVSIGQLQWGTKVEAPFGVGTGYDPNQEQLRVNFNEGQTGNIIGSNFRFVARRAEIRLPLLPTTFVDGTTLGQWKEFWDNHAGDPGNPFFYNWNAGNPGSFEKDTMFGVADFNSGVRRPLATQLDVGFRDLELTVNALKE